MRHRLFTLLFVFCALLPAEAALAQATQEASPKELMRKAAFGDPVAASEVAYMYQTGGGGLKKNDAAAFSYFQMAADADYADAETNLGILYTNGIGTPQNYGMAFQWFERAATHANVNAEFNLGNLYAMGNGVKQDYTKAYQYYRLAAEAGNVDAEYALGQAYMEGKGITKNDTEASKWLRLAADQGNAKAERHMAELYKSGKAAGSAEANAAGMFEMYKKAAFKGDAEAQYNYALMIESGAAGITADPQTALQWYWRAANQGQPEAQHALGKAFYAGKGTAQDYRQAWFWFALAARYSHRAGYSDDRDESSQHVPPAEMSADQLQVSQWKPTREPKPAAPQ